MQSFFKQKILFLLGKGGVGRSTAAASLGYHCSQRRGENVLIIQWSLNDAISPLFGAPECGHKHHSVLPDLSVMNYDGDEAMKEYFTEHLNMGFFYHFVLENRQVQKLIHAAPGLEELFFLGRLFWVAELAEAERGYRFDRILIDSPATGHGSALFGMAATISRFKLSGPLVSETSRVARLLEDEEKVGTILVTLPEELPVEETLEMIPSLTLETGRPPLAIVLNRSLKSLLREPAGARGDLSSEKMRDSPTFPGGRLEALNQLTDGASVAARAIYEDLLHRLEWEDRLRTSTDLPILALPDLMVSLPDISGRERTSLLAGYFE